VFFVSVVHPVTSNVSTILCTPDMYHFRNHHKISLLEKKDNRTSSNLPYKHMARARNNDAFTKCTALDHIINMSIKDGEDDGLEDDTRTTQNDGE
jgi:hypothetical protein